MIRFLFATACAALTLVGQAHAQTAVQPLSISFLGEYQSNSITTNGTLITTQSFTPTILITTANLVRALSVDVAGRGWTNWAGARLVREINLATTNEGIYLRRGAQQTNVSRYFNGFSNNFTAGLSNYFPAVSNFTNQVNVDTTNSYMPPIDISRGFAYDQSGSNTSNYHATWGVHSLGFQTTNLQFNLVGTSYGFHTNVSGKVDGVPYHQDVKTETITFSGIFSVNVTSNVFDIGTTTPPVYLGGPVHGTFTVDAAAFSPISVTNNGD